METHEPKCHPDKKQSKGIGVEAWQLLVDLKLVPLSQKTISGRSLGLKWEWDGSLECNVRKLVSIVHLCLELPELDLWGAKALCLLEATKMM